MKAVVAVVAVLILADVGLAGTIVANRALAPAPVRVAQEQDDRGVSHSCKAQHPKKHGKSKPAGCSTDQSDS